ncbi:MAG: hypothetical protein OER77_02910 [Myxococcales bacterium]|nr:hypothetical protein [Myxococcales bacterium]
MTNDSKILDSGIDSIGSSCDWLEQRLREEGVTVHSNSRLAEGFRAVSKLHVTFLSGPVLRCSPKELYSLWTPAVGIDFLSKGVHRAWEGGLRPPKHLWKALASGDPNVFAGAKSKQERNQVWELLVGCLGARFCEHVAFDEPDVVCDFKGSRVNVSMKVAYSDKNLWANALKGFKQAKTQSGDFDIVVVNVLELMPVHALLKDSIEQRFTDPAALECWVKTWATKWCEGRALAKLQADIERQIERPMTVAFFMPILVTFGEKPMPVGVFYVHAPLTTQGRDYEFVHCLLHACNTTLIRVAGDSVGLDC